MLKLMASEVVTPNLSEKTLAVILILKNFEPCLRQAKPLMAMASVASRKSRSFQALQAL